MDWKNTSCENNECSITAGGVWSPKVTPSVILEITLTVLFGLSIGSFLNVCICRIPEELSVVKPPSNCPKCNNAISWYDNIPVLSYILLRGKCRHCSTKISVQYPLIELLFAVILLHLYYHYFDSGYRLIAVTYFGAFSACLLTATVIDLKHYIIPDEINLAGIIIACIGAMVYPRLVNEDSIWAGLLHSALGIGAGFASLRLVVYIGGIIFRREAMGLGDPKFLAMIGAFIGFKMALLVIFISSLLGALVGSIVIYLFRSDKSNTVIPYGPFLALGGYVALLYGNDLVQWYIRLISFE
ncbi:MAG: prepilin peptidase [Candidatus Auribacterota bacterium]